MTDFELRNYLIEDLWANIFNRIDEFSLYKISNIDEKLFSRYFQRIRLPWYCKSVYAGSWNLFYNSRMNVSDSKTMYYCYIHRQWEQIKYRLVSRIGQPEKRHYCYYCQSACYASIENQTYLMLPLIIDINEESGQFIYNPCCFRCLAKKETWKCITCDLIFDEKMPKRIDHLGNFRCISPSCNPEIKKCVCKDRDSDSEEECWICG